MTDVAVIFAACAAMDAVGVCWTRAVSAGRVAAAGAASLVSYALIYAVVVAVRSDWRLVLVAAAGHALGTVLTVSALNALEKNKETA